MKKSLFALVLAFVLIFSFACAPADTAGTSGTTATTEAAQLNIAESDCIVFLSVKETEKDNYKWYYKTVTNAEDIAAIAEAVENAFENAEVKTPLAEGELAKSRASFFRIRILNDGIAGGTVIVYDDGITSGADYLVDTAELISSLSEIYERIDSEEQPAI